jgi:hypothetical protein
MYLYCNIMARSCIHCCHGNATVCSLCIVELHTLLSTTNIETIAMQTQTKVQFICYVSLYATTKTKQVNCT